MLCAMSKENTQVLSVKLNLITKNRNGNILDTVQALYLFNFNFLHFFKPS